MVRFGIDGVAGVMAELRHVVQEKYGSGGSSSRWFVPRIGFFFFFVGDATQVFYENNPILSPSSFCPKTRLQSFTSALLLVCINGSVCRKRGCVS